MNRAEAEQIAAAVTLIRPDWLRTSLVTLLGKHQQRPARDVMLALVWIAFDPDTKGPGRIDADGPWWLTARLAATETERPPYLAVARCPQHGQALPCLACQRPTQIADLATIRRIRAEARDIPSCTEPTAANDAGVTLNPQDRHTPAPDGAGLPSEEQNRFSNDVGEDRR